MRYLLIILSIIGLGLTVFPSFLVFVGVIEFELNIVLMTIGTVLWFVTAPFWINKEKTGKTA